MTRPLRRTYVVGFRNTDELLWANTNGCLDLRRRASALDGGVSADAPWHGGLEIVWLHCDEAQQVGCLRGLEGCTAGVGRRHPVTIRKASLMAGSMRRV